MPCSQQRECRDGRQHGAQPAGIALLPRHDPCRGALVELQLRHLVDDFGTIWMALAPVPMTATRLPVEVDAVVPLSRMEGRALEVGQPVDVGDGRDVQRAGPGDQELGDVFLAVFGEDVPADSASSHWARSTCWPNRTYRRRPYFSATPAGSRGSPAGRTTCRSSRAWVRTRTSTGAPGCHRRSRDSCCRARFRRPRRPSPRSGKSTPRAAVRFAMPRPENPVPMTRARVWTGGVARRTLGDGHATKVPDTVISTIRTAAARDRLPDRIPDQFDAEQFGGAVDGAQHDRGQVLTNSSDGIRRGCQVRAQPPVGGRGRRTRRWPRPPTAARRVQLHARAVRWLNISAIVMVIRGPRSAPHRGLRLFREASLQHEPQTLGCWSTG